jgi:hypothetical protein
MQDPLGYARFNELASLLGPKTFTYGKIDPCYNLIIMCNWGRPPTQKRLKYHAIGLKGIGPASRCKAAPRHILATPKWVLKMDTNSYPFHAQAVLCKLGFKFHLAKRIASARRMMMQDYKDYCQEKQLFWVQSDAMICHKSMAKLSISWCY